MLAFGGRCWEREAPPAEQALNHPWLQAEASPLQEPAASAHDAEATAPAKDVVAASDEKRNEVYDFGGGDTSIGGA